MDLIKLCGNASEALKQAPELSKRGGRIKPIKIHSKAEALQEIENCHHMGAEVISYKDPDYPKILLHIDDFPPIITISGNKKLLNRRNIGIVGARNASANGCRFAYKLAEDLGQAKLNVISGLARGIDTAAHKGSIETGTIAVIAGGIDNVYPLENKGLYQEIAAKGVIVAELPYGTAPRGQNFPQRNRIISGLSLGVAVIEASFGSGSLITARIAGNQNKEVFAVPGFPWDPRCQGTNSLIKQGAKLLESYKDILEEISNINFDLFDIKQKNYIVPNLPKLCDYELNKARTVIKSLLSASPVNIDDLIRMCDFNITIVLTVVLELELAGKIERHPGNKVSLSFNEI